MRLDLKLVLPECASQSGACPNNERSDHQGMLCCTMHASTRFTAPSMHSEQDLLIFVGLIMLHCWGPLEVAVKRKAEPPCGG